MSAPSSDEMYARLMAIHRDACATGHYEVSYYVLLAALYLASEMGDDTRLTAIARELVAFMWAIAVTVQSHQ